MKKKLNKLIKKARNINRNKFQDSLLKFYEDYGYLTNKQIKALEDSFIIHSDMEDVQDGYIF